ncbi:methyl-accepting chemotaxis protein [Oxalobacteraceae bacterium GrIS 1.11]
MKTTLKTRLGVMIGLLSLLALAIGLLGLYGMGAANEGLRTVYEDRTVALDQLSRIDRLLLQNQLTMADALNEPGGAPARLGQVEQNLSTVDALWTQYMATYLTPEEQLLAHKFAADRTIMLKDGLLPMLQALREGKIDVASAWRERMRPLAQPVRAGAEALSKLQVDVARQEYELAVRRHGMLRSVMIMAIVLGVLAGVLCGVFMIRSIYRQLGGEPAYAAQIVHSIAGGDLTVAVNTAKNDQHSLLFAMQTMQSALARTVGEIRISTDALSTASGQIAAGNMDLSSRTEQQASSLEETASSMEELTSTVKQNGDNAQQANQLAVTASAVAVEGGKVVAQVVLMMGALNESAKKIADIIGVIDGIAFQTNILALNAAVEAARAGEHGRGFAVVATEVRSLAQRAAGAAKEIKVLIDASVGKVDAGGALVAQAGSTMEEIVASVQRVTDIMGEISSASREQQAGIEQINRAITEMDGVTQQNAALVEQAAAAASALQDQTGILAQAVSVFKVGEPERADEPDVRFDMVVPQVRLGADGGRRALTRECAQI